MSLEQAVAANTAAIEKLITMWGTLAANAKSIAAEVDTGAAVTLKAGGVTVAKVKTPKSAAPAGALPSQENTGQGATTATETTVSPSEVTYEMVSKAILAMATADRPRLVATLAQFGVKRGPELKPEQFSAFVEAMV